MPSPIAHAALALVVRAFADRTSRLQRAIGSRPAFFYPAVVAALWAPDIDFLIRVFFEHPSLRHGAATHSLVFAAVFGGIFAAACCLRYGPALPMAPVLGIGVACAMAHAFMDMATWGGGVMLLWPFSMERFSTAVPFFYGARHSQPTAWGLHLVTLATELPFVLLLWMVARRYWQRDDAAVTPTKAPAAPGERNVIHPTR
jgi:membrane-bound metal-dependent hydrolase YbcI (DUF457 family)